MNRSELTEALAKRHNLTVKEAEVIIKTIFEEMTQALKDRKRIEIRGFGSFAVKEYGAYVGRNPKTGEKIQVQNKCLPFFRVGKQLRDQLAEAGRLEEEGKSAPVGGGEPSGGASEG